MNFHSFTRLIIVASLTVLISGCSILAPSGSGKIDLNNRILAPIGSSVLNNTLGDEALLTFTPTGLSFNPGSSVALDVILVIEGKNVTATIKQSPCLVLKEGVQCHLGNVTTLTSVLAQGENVTATVTYRRSGSNRLYLEVPSDS